MIVVLSIFILRYFLFYLGKFRQVVNISGVTLSNVLFKSKLLAFAMKPNDRRDVSIYDFNLPMKRTQKLTTHIH